MLVGRGVHTLSSGSPALVPDGEDCGNPISSLGIRELGRSIHHHLLWILIGSSHVSLIPSSSKGENENYTGKVERQHCPSLQVGCEPGEVMGDSGVIQNP